MKKKLMLVILMCVVTSCNYKHAGTTYADLLVKEGTNQSLVVAMQKVLTEQNIVLSTNEKDVLIMLQSDISTITISTATKKGEEIIILKSASDKFSGDSITDKNTLTSLLKRVV